ncbi:MAG: hypothetical protein AAGK78_02710, partial [Planctomycetota bacterium]
MTAELLTTVPQAMAILDALPVSPRVERRALLETNGCVLAEDVAADRDYPAFDKSLMDGFAAVVGASTEPLQLIGEVAAGTSWSGPPLVNGQAVRIMTGAPLPTAADGLSVGVVPVEQATVTNDRVAFDVDVAADRYIARRGSDRGEGEVVLSSGTRLSARHVATLATLGIVRPAVFAPPK